VEGFRRFPFSIHPRLFISSIRRMTGAVGISWRTLRSIKTASSSKTRLFPRSLRSLGKRASIRRPPRSYLRTQSRIVVRLMRVRPEWGISQERSLFSRSNRSRSPRERRAPPTKSLITPKRNVAICIFCSFSIENPPFGVMALSNSLPPFGPTTRFGRFSPKKKSWNFKWTDLPESPLADKASQKPAEGHLPSSLPEPSAPGGSKTATSAPHAAGKS
jgi:hypothetical protein